jgi:hypothetical protein
MTIKNELDRLSLFPDHTQATSNGLSLGGCDLAELAEEYGTPFYLYDQAHWMVQLLYTGAR